MSTRSEAIEAFVQDFADEPCAYKDNCPPFGGTRHGTCLPCRARRVLSQPAPPSYVDRLRAEGGCGAMDHPIFKLPCTLPFGHAGPHDNESSVTWFSVAPQSSNRCCTEIEMGGPEDCRQMCPGDTDLWCPSCRHLPRTRSEPPAHGEGGER